MINLMRLNLFTTRNIYSLVAIEHKNVTFLLVFSSFLFHTSGPNREQKGIMKFTPQLCQN
jgi:hypothetical protein